MMFSQAPLWLLLASYIYTASPALGALIETQSEDDLLSFVTVFATRRR
jgi:hypothetical protein